MNVVNRNTGNGTAKKKVPDSFIRKNCGTGILGSSTIFTSKPLSATHSRFIPKTPKYSFQSGSDNSKRKTSSMGPPTEPLRSVKRKPPHLSLPSSSTRADTSSSSVRHRILAPDSLTDSSKDMCTPRNRPAALRYISSSSRGRSGLQSARSTGSSLAEPSVILAISEGRGMARGEIGLAAVDLKRPNLVLCQFSDNLVYTHTLTKINYFNPVEIIVPHTFCEGFQPSQLYQLIKDQFPSVAVSTVQRRHFNDAVGLHQIQELCAPDYKSVNLLVLHKFYALTATAAVLKYVEYIQCVVFAKESLKIEYHCSENTMLIDVGTAMQLELVQPIEAAAGPTCCLLGILGPTYTVGGIRALRAAILQPPCNKDVIEARLDCVQELIENDEGLMVSLQDVIKKLSDVEKILFLCIESPNQDMNKMTEAQLNQTLILKRTMELVPILVEALIVANCGLLRKIKMDLENPHYREILNEIRKIIQDDAHLEKGNLGNIQRCFAVKPEINGLLDVARRTYYELIEDIQKIVEQLSEAHDLPLRLNQNTLKGFHIVLPLPSKARRTFKIDALPQVFIQVQHTGASVTLTTEDLAVLDQQAKESLNEIQAMSNIVIYGLLKELRPYMSSLYRLCENVAELDILLALAQASSVGAYIRPDFNEYLELRNCVHPLLDYNSQVAPVANDAFASPEYNFTIITGPNMGGKSIYLKQIAVLHIMAQVGCFLPATSAVLRLTDHLFSRIGFNDSVELNASSYVLEMKEIQHILQNITPNSLVIIDELCRGTCCDEGSSIAWAVCEELLKKDAFTFFTTHFLYLTKLEEMYFNVVNLHTAVSEEVIANTDLGRRLVYKHKIEKGATTIEKYGLALAKNTFLPTETIKLAEELAEVIAGSRKVSMLTDERSDEKLLYKLNSDIKNEMRRSFNSEENIKVLLEKFKNENIDLIEKVIKTVASRIIEENKNNTVVEKSNENRENQCQYSTVTLSRQSSSESQDHDQEFETVLTHAIVHHQNNGADDFYLDNRQTHATNLVPSYKRIQTTSQIGHDIEMPPKDIDKNVFAIDDLENLNLLNNMHGHRHKNKKIDISNEERDIGFAKTMQEDIISDFEDINSISTTTKEYLKQNLADIPNNPSESNISAVIQHNTDRENEYFEINSDSDIAEALTQVIVETDEECMSEKSTLKLGLLENSDDSDTELSSVDESLIRETIDEINRSIQEECLLPPPAGF